MMKCFLQFQRIFLDGVEVSVRISNVDFGGKYFKELGFQCDLIIFVGVFGLVFFGNLSGWKNFC